MKKYTLLTPDDVCLQIVDVQHSLMAKIYDAEAVAATVELVVRCAKILKIPVLANTQYVKGLGQYVTNIEALLDDVPRIDKTEFNAIANKATAAFFDELPEKITTIILVGVETHICIYQTAMGLLDRGYNVWIVADGVSSRKISDHRTGIDRLQSAGTVVGSAEMLIYELLGRAGTAEFKQVLPLIVNKG